MIVTIIAVVFLTGLVIGTAMALAPTFEPVHEHDAHDSSLGEVAYDASNDIVWSIDGDGTFVGYYVSDESIVVEEDLGMGHAIAIGDEQVYVAAGDHLYAVDVDEGSITTLQSELAAHPSAMAYDAARELIWIAGHDEVHAYDLDGELDRSISPGEGEPHDIAVNDEYVAWTTGFNDEVIVWDIDAESVAYEPDFPDGYEAAMTVGIDLTDANELIVGTDGEGSMVAMFDIEEEAVVVEYREHIFSVNQVAYHAAENVIVSGGADNQIVVYDVAEDTVLERHDHSDTVFAVSLDLTNDLLWVGDGEERSPTVMGLAFAAADPTPTPAPEPTPTPDITPTPTPDTTSADDTPTPEPADTPTPEGEDTPTPVDDQPGFGALIGGIALLAVAFLARRYR